MIISEGIYAYRLHKTTQKHPNNQQVFMFTSHTAYLYFNGHFSVMQKLSTLLNTL